MKTLVAFCLFSVSCQAQAKLPQVGRRAPAVDLSDIFQAPAGTPLNSASFRGKPVVLEFWATWCGGCVAAIPHLNSLVRQFQGRSVVFLSITDEEPAVVQAFLKRRLMRGWIGVDNDDATYKRFGIFGRPQTILIDSYGIVRGVTYPDHISPAVIERLIAGKPTGLPAWQVALAVRSAARLPGEPAPLLDVEIRPAAPASVSGFSPGAITQSPDGRLTHYGASLRQLLAYADTMRGDRIVAPPWFDQSRYDLFLTVPHGREDLRTTMAGQALKNTFQLVTRRETRPTEVYVLRVAANRAGRMRSSAGTPSDGFRAAPGHFTGVATGIPRIVHAIAPEIGGKEIIDETGLTGHYDFDLRWTPGSLGSLQEALRSQLGLSLALETRPEPYLVVVSAVEPTTW